MTVPRASGLTVLQVIIGIFAFLPRPLWWHRFFRRNKFGFQTWPAKISGLTGPIRAGRAMVMDT